MKIKFSNPKKLIKHLKKGDESAYNFLIETYYKRLCDYAYSLSKDTYKAEDIVQSVMIRVWEQRHNLQSTFSIKNFLYKSIYNEFIDQYRKEVAVTMLEKKYIEGLSPIFEEDNEHEIERLITLVRKEIEQLPPKCRETFILSKQEGLTYVEIADYQKVSINTVEAQMSKAFSIIRKKIGEKTDAILFLLFGIRPLQK